MSIFPSSVPLITLSSSPSPTFAQKLGAVQARGGVIRMARSTVRAENSGNDGPEEQLMVDGTMPTQMEGQRQEQMGKLDRRDEGRGREMKKQKQKRVYGTKGANSHEQTEEAGGGKQNPKVHGNREQRSGAGKPAGWRMVTRKIGHAESESMAVVAQQQLSLCITSNLDHGDRLLFTCPRQGCPYKLYWSRDLCRAYGQEGVHNHPPDNNSGTSVAEQQLFSPNSSSASRTVQPLSMEPVERPETTPYAAGCSVSPVYEALTPDPMPELIAGEPESRQIGAGPGTTGGQQQQRQREQFRLAPLEMHFRLIAWRFQLHFRVEKGTFILSRVVQPDQCMQLLLFSEEQREGHRNVRVSEFCEQRSGGRQGGGRIGQWTSQSSLWPVADGGQEQFLLAVSRSGDGDKRKRG